MYSLTVAVPPPPPPPKIRFHSYFHIFVAQYAICPDNFGLFFFFGENVFQFSRNYFLSFDRSNMQIFIVNITRVVWPRVTNKLDLRYFCQQNPLFYHLNLIPCHYWSWQTNIYFVVIFFCPTYFSYVEKKYQNKDSFKNDRWDRIYWASSF